MNFVMNVFECDLIDERHMCDNGCSPWAHVIRLLEYNNMHDTFIYQRVCLHFLSYAYAIVSVNA